MQNLEEVLKSAIRGIDAIITMPECTVNAKETELKLMHELQGVLSKAIKGINPIVTMPECTDKQK
jgi:hypothetical protein